MAFAAWVRLHRNGFDAVRVTRDGILGIWCHFGRSLGLEELSLASWRWQEGGGEQC